jgi:tellurite methyltransferase
VADGEREHWNARWAGREATPRSDSSLLQLATPWLPPSGRLLDVAGGGSGDAVRLAQLGLDVTVVDVSDVGLAMTTELAAAAHTSVGTCQTDLESDSPPPGPWDVITLANYLNRPLTAELTELLLPGGILVLVLATATNLERSPRPSAAHLVDPGEIPRLARGLKTEHHSEDWRANGRHEAWYVGRWSAEEDKKP